MNAPCGHKSACCVIGNYWECPICDADLVTSSEIIADNTPGKLKVTVFLGANITTDFLPALPNCFYALSPRGRLTTPYEAFEDDVRQMIIGEMASFRVGTTLRKVQT